jgi:hypothetical protein
MNRTTLLLALVLATAPFASLPAEAAAYPGAAVIATAAPSFAEPAQVRRGGAVRHGYVARGPRGGVVGGRRAAVVRPVFRPGYGPVRPVPVRPVVVAPGWRRPTADWWRPGAAVVAGAAVGFVTAAAATSYVNSRLPGPGYCWYYTSPRRTAGFWDV